MGITLLNIYKSVKFKTWDVRQNIAFHIHIYGTPRGGSQSQNILGEIQNLLKNKHILANFFAVIGSFSIIFSQNKDKSVLYQLHTKITM